MKKARKSLKQAPLGKAAGPAGGGRVFLVGAGPGRPELLTLRGAECLAEADVVVMDALVDRRLLGHCRPAVRVVEAGKRGDGRVFMRQPAINRLLVKLARAGKNVVRLKGGDPYFFGRGGEEAEALQAARVPFETVPGVSSVSAVPAYAGMPITHRAHTSMVTVVTGHPGAENTYTAGPGASAGVDWARVSPKSTLVVLMGVLRLPDIARRLRAAGWPASTPAAVVRWGTYPVQRTVSGTLGDIGRRAAEAGLRPPAVVVIGSVVSLRRRLNWFESLPLFGRTVVVTRAAEQAGDLARLLERDGARAVFASSIDVTPLPLTAQGRRRLKEAGRCDGVLFTSVNAVKIFAGHWADREWPFRTAVYAVGPKTAAALAAAGLPVHAVARDSAAESLAERLGDVRGRRFLFPRAEDGRETLIRRLEAKGASVDLWPLYRTRPRRLEAGTRRTVLAEADAVTFGSSSAVRAFMENFTSAERRRLFARARAVSIGPVTTRTLRDYGIRPLEAARPTIEDLAAAVRRGLAGRDR